MVHRSHDGKSAHAPGHGADVRLAHGLLGDQKRGSATGIVFQDAHQQNGIYKLICMRGGDNDDRAAFGNPPCAARVDLAEEDVQTEGENPHSEVVQPRDHKSARHDCVCNFTLMLGSGAQQEKGRG